MVIRYAALMAALREVTSNVRQTSPPVVDTAAPPGVVRPYSSVCKRTRLTIIYIARAYIREPYLSVYRSVFMPVNHVETGVLASEG